MIRGLQLYRGSWEYAVVLQLLLGRKKKKKEENRNRKERKRKVE